MLSCPRCGNESPDGSLHCVHCGARLGEAAHQATQFGMPQLRPAPGKGPQTTQFGAEDLARLAAAAAEDEEEAPASAPVPSLMAGLPRPRVSSAPSPLTEGLKKPVRATPAQPSARSTVMGMPIYADAMPRPTPSASAQTMAAEAPEPGVGPASIQSLDGFAVGTPAPQAGAGDEAATVVDDAAAREAAAEAARVVQVAQTIDAEQTDPDLPAAEEPATVLDAPTAPVEDDVPTHPRAAAVARPAPVPAARAAVPSTDAWGDEESGGDSGAGLSRGMAALVGASVAGLALQPAKGMWFWDAVGALQGMERTGLMAAGGCGVAVLLLAALPIPSGVRNALTLVLGGLGVLGLALS